MPLTLPALSDTIVSTTKFRANLPAHLKQARNGQVVTVYVNGDDDNPVAVIERKTLAALYAEVADLQDRVEALLETTEILSDPGTLQALQHGLAQAEADDVVTPSDLRAQLGWTAKKR